jgi:hypothetical protein
MKQSSAPTPVPTTARATKPTATKRIDPVPDAWHGIGYRINPRRNTHEETQEPPDGADTSRANAGVTKDWRCDPVLPTLPG